MWNRGGKRKEKELLEKWGLEGLKKIERKEEEEHRETEKKRMSQILKFSKELLTNLSTK